MLNLGTILITILLILLIAGIILVLIKDKKQGRSSCGGSCAHCNMCAACKNSGRPER
ncbi:MAG: FeoB-associated Cys-rich membrane protein [Lachnospiraceae bacterium]|nr:FeoB-associated Cys-rich membrane protein [Lachnospiraceae bacterium]